MRNIYNGGITLGIGNYTLKCISAYVPNWSHEIETNFENWNFSTVEQSKGRRFSADITTGILSDEEITKLLKVLFGRTFTFTSPEYTGTVSVTKAPKTYNSANTAGIYCTCSFSVAAVSLDGTSGSL